MSNFVELTSSPLDVGSICGRVSADSTGAVSLFVGTTRDNFEGKTVLRLEYEAYEAMAERVMGRLCQQVRDKWRGVHSVAISHRLGPVGLREASVVIAISSEHRGDSLEAVRFAIDELKATVPIWKKEVYEGDSTQWKQNKECKWSSDPTNVDLKQERASEVVDDKSDDEDKVDPSMIQINASSEEISRRMEAFMERKRAELDRNNVLEFCNRAVADDNGDGDCEDEVEVDGVNEFSCARVDSVVPSRGGDRSGHIRHSQVVNPSGPQTLSDYMDRHFDPLEHSMKRSRSDRGHQGDGGEERRRKEEEEEDLPVGIRERMVGLEAKLVEGRPISRDIYQRLKALEDRVRYLEGLSPEYLDFLPKRRLNDRGEREEGDGDGWKPSSSSSVAAADVENSLVKINTRIQELQKSLKTKANSRKDS